MLVAVATVIATFKPVCTRNKSWFGTKAALLSAETVYLLLLDFGVPCIYENNGINLEIKKNIRQLAS